MKTFRKITTAMKELWLRLLVSTMLIPAVSYAADSGGSGSGSTASTVFDTKQFLGSSAENLTVTGKLALIFGNIFSLIIFTLVAIVFIWSIIRVGRVLYEARKEEDYSSFLKDAGLAIAAIVVTLLVAGFAFTYGIDNLATLQTTTG